MKVLFLDIDGVCNSANWVKQGNEIWHGVDPAAAALVQRIIKETGCKVVLSSTWRLYPEAREQVRRKVCSFIDCTVDMQRGGKWGVADRGYEVQEWLDRHPAVTEYAILDDNSDFLPNQWLFQTTWENGINEEIAQAVIHHLTASERQYKRNVLTNSR